MKVSNNEQADPRPVARAGAGLRSGCLSPEAASVAALAPAWVPATVGGEEAAPLGGPWRRRRLVRFGSRMRGAGRGLATQAARATGA